MDIVIVLYNGMTTLDAIGPYDVLGHLPGARVRFVGAQPGPISTDQGHALLAAQSTFDAVDRADVVVVPGGPRRDPDPELVRWLAAVDPTTTWTTSVCTGSLILAAAGLLTGRKATTHWAAYDRLTALGAVLTPDRVVMDGKYVTGAGVSAGIDMALTLAGRIAGDRVAQAIQLGIEYDPQPPYECGSPAAAGPELVEALLSRSS
jgi:putative intracellular protease/amidase